MGIKFNCSNPECRQRIEVDDSLAGTGIQCPGCATKIQAPLSHDIRFACTNAECRQHVVVDVSEAGRFVKCPSCGKTLRAPGDPPKPLIRPPPTPAPKESITIPAMPSRFAPVKRLLWGWGAGATLFGVILSSSHLYQTS